MTVTTSNNRMHPQPYTCANFSECGVSSSHDPTYVGWPWVYRGYRWYHSEACATKAEIRKALART